MGKLTIQEIAKILVEKNKLTQKEANQFAASLFEVIQQGLDNEGLVKVKGLGTFKKIQVEARESVSVRTGERVVIDSHAKITFAPDALMKELVNKPFSQFETVILNDGVEFEDLADDLTEEELAEVEALDNIIAEDPKVIAEEPKVIVEEPKVIAEEPKVIAEEPQPVAQPLMEIVDDEHEKPEEEEEADEEFGEEDEAEKSSSWKKTAGYLLLTLLLMGASAYAGYWYGQHSGIAVNDEFDTETEVVDTIEVIEIDSLDMIDQPLTEEAEIEVTESEQQPQASTPQPQTSTPQAQTEEEPFWKKYEKMDARVRTGAYHIIGTDHEVKVRQGETLSRIARRELGEGMSCYIEVYNGLNANSELKEGQVIKIPKLKWKKKRSIE